MAKPKTVKKDLKETLLSEFKSFEKHLNGASADPLHIIRINAKECFDRIGFPERKAEEWKYTNTNSITRYDFHQFLPKKDSDLTQKDFEQFLTDGLETNIILLINGRYSYKLSKTISNTQEVYIGSFKDARNKYSKIVQNHFSKYADYKNDGFTALNTAFAFDGAFIYIPDGIELKEPVQILNIFDSRYPNLLSQPRNLVVAGKNSTITVIETFFTIGNNNNLCNTVTEISVEENSDVDYYKIQNDSNKSFHIGTTQVHQEKDSNFNSVTISWGGKITRNNLNSILNGSSCECCMFGAYVLSDEQHVDNHTLVDHAVPNCNSNELYKGILDDNSTGIFNGKIMVRKDAQNTNAYQSNNNILLTNSATVNTKPQLEIFADDVKCSHGATTGQLDKDELFYLRTRGIGETEAKAMLLYAFASEVIQNRKIDPLRIELLQKLNSKLNKD
jgi:Fe-S cluster assembly protein SufD